MNRIRRTARVAGSALATLLLAVTAPGWVGGTAMAQQTPSAAESGMPAQAAPTGKAAPGQHPDKQRDETANAGKAAKPGGTQHPSKSAQAGKAAGATGATGLFKPFKEGNGQDEGEPPPGLTGLGGASPVTRIHGEYDINELRRLIDLARDSGFTDEQLHQITVEDEHGNVVNALEFLKAYDKRKKEEAAKEEAERKKVYLSPKDILNELDKEQPKDLDKLRDKMLFVN